MRANSRPHKILVVDDDALIREMMVDILDGYSVQTARNGREALDTLRSGENYLVFLDLMMPVMTGQELCQKLCAEPDIRNRHIIFIMSAADKLGQATMLEADGTMRKPFSFDDVMLVVETHVEAH